MRLPRPALLALALALVPGAARAGLLEGNHPKVAQGTEAFQKGDWEGALKAYEEAQRELPNSPELQYDLGDVYMKLGRSEDARRAYEQALSKAGEGLKPRDYFNLGNSLVELNQKADAINAYRQALKLDPHFEPARHNLEVLLRKKEPPKDGPPSPMDGGLPPDAGLDGGTDAGHSADSGQGKDNPDAGAQDGGASDAGADKGDGGSSDAGGKGDGGAGDGGQGDGGADGGGKDNSSADGGSPDAGSQDGGTMQPAPNSEPPPKEVDIKRLLDAARRHEKQFLMQQHDKKVKPNARPEKDW